RRIVLGRRPDRPVARAAGREGSEAPPRLTPGRRPMAKQVMKSRRKAKLPQAPVLEPRRKRTLIVVADGARARFLKPSEDLRKLVPADDADMLSPHARRPS